MASGSNMLQLPFRRTHTVQMSEAIKQYISNKYDQHPDMFAKDLEAIDALRKSAVTSNEPHISGIPKLQAYSAQLVWLAGKFPIDVGVDFPWYPALGYNTSRPITENNIKFELANVVFNLAALYSQLGLQTNRTKTDGMKVACNYFSLAAGVLSYLRTSIIPEMRSERPPEDMDVMTLECLEHLMLAQTQEVFWRQAIAQKLKDASIAKIAAKVSDFYSSASDFGVKSDAIESEWIHHMAAKHHHFAAAAQYRQAMDCLEKRKYGEEIARLRDSLACANEGRNEVRYISNIVAEELNGLRNRVTEDLKRAEKDNDMIYIQAVPPKSELAVLARFDYAKAKIPEELSDPLSKLGDHGELGRPLFNKLVPYSVHLAASIYADRRDRLINKDIIEELEVLNDRIHQVLTSLNLPGALQALEKPLGVPPAVIAHADEMRDQKGMDRLYHTIEEANKQRGIDMALYQEGVDLLRAEQAEDERARMRYGTERWTRPSSIEAAPKLWKQIPELEGYFKQAAASDQTVQQKMRGQERYINIMAPESARSERDRYREIEEFVPSSRRTTVNGMVEREIGKLRGCLNEVNRLEARRKRKIDAVRMKAKQDDINAELLKEAARLERQYPMQGIEAVQFEGLFDKRLEMYNEDKATVQEEEQEQSQVLQRLQEANKSFAIARKGDQSSKEREKALQTLENAYYKYKEIINNLEAGRRFYNDLNKIVTRFRDECRSFIYQRRAEASQIEADVTTGMASLSLTQANALQEQRRAEAANLQNQAKVPAAAPQEPLTAPTPTRVNAGPSAGMWTPEMGIKFGGEQKKANAPAPQDARWNASKGLKFG